MSAKSKIAVIAPVLVLVVMYPVFQFLAHIFPGNWRIAWLLGLFIYWIIWGLGFSWLMIGKKTIQALITPQRPTFGIFLLVLFPLIMTAIFKFIPGGTAYDKTDTLMYLFVLLTPFFNGFFEETLWRGVYMTLFPRNLWLRIVWPGIWFALWHYAPGSISPNKGHVLALMIGALFLGLYSAFLAKRTNTIWWSIIVHVLGGIIIVI
ncbi:MAG: CPBP family intramembrane metalloprotease [candidate division WOR-3 bacterium]|nr:MAG: CPBP family intramembrane metalloprotease [candidate division WOR-3 bacterium]